MKEMYFDLKKNWLFVTLKVILISVFFVIMYISLSFTKSTDQAIDKTFSVNQEVNLYSLMDTFFNSEEFSVYRESTDSINKVGAFYNYLNESSSFSFLSVFNQPIPIIDFQGDESFDYGYNTEISIKGKYLDENTNENLQDIKALQMNQKTFSFYNLQIMEGNSIAWETIEYPSSNKTNIPVILGNDYSSVYKVGDIISGYLYFEKIDFEVVGILTENSSIFYKNELNKFIDNYMIIPYPNKLEEVDETNKFFSGILYFAMINGDIIVNKDMSTENLLVELERIASKSDFFNYTLLNVPTYLTQFTLMRTIIKKNLLLIILITILISIALLFLLTFINNLLFRRRYYKFQLLWLKGESIKKIEKILFMHMSKEYVFICLSSIAFYTIVSNYQFDLLKFLLFIQLLYFIFDYMTARIFLKRNLNGGYKND